MSKVAVERLAQLLDVERTALLSGDFDAVGALAPEKEKLAQQFDDSDARYLRTLSATLARNTALLAAAQEGVSTVLLTLKAQREARMTLSSYDSSGNAMKITQPKRGTERRF
jgi:hypothetical protein